MTDLPALVTVSVRTTDGARYLDHADLTAHLAVWIKAALVRQHGIADVVVTAHPESAVSVPAPTPTDRAARAMQYGQVLRRWGLLDEVNNPKDAEDFAVTDLLAVADAEQAELRHERDLAIAHDRQPYPTAWAYEQACSALNSHREKAETRRLALSQALGLGTGAPWETIRDRAAELAAPAGRAAVYAEVADRLAADAEQGDKGGLTRIYRRSAATQVHNWADELRRAADEAQQPETQAPDRVVAHVPTARAELHCLRCAPPPLGDIWTAVTAEELEDGGICTRCGADVLIALSTAVQPGADPS